MFPSFPTPSLCGNVRAMTGRRSAAIRRHGSGSSQPLRNRLPWTVGRAAGATSTGLRYYGYRYCDPVTGRWPSRDSIEEWGGVNLYGFVGNDGVLFVDISGLIGWGPGGGPGQCDSGGQCGVDYPSPPTPTARRAAIKKKFDQWFRDAMKPENQKKIDDLPDCPCELDKCSKCVVTSSPSSSLTGAQIITEFCAPEGWELVPAIVSRSTLPKFHPGGEYDLRTPKASGESGQQCIYDRGGKLITHGRGAGTPDGRGPGGAGAPPFDNGHGSSDVEPYNWALELDDSDEANPDPNGEYYQKYMRARTPNRGRDPKTGRECPRNP
jgi:RHS repeat-associated protein